MFKIETQVELAPNTTLGVGGKAEYYARVTSEAELRDALAWANKQASSVHVLGGGSNLVVGDGGVSGLVVEVDLRGIRIDDGAPRQASSTDTILVHVAAGEPWDDFVAKMVERGHQGLECLSGIPGRVGATPIQNVGAYGQDVSETVESVRALDRTSLVERRFSRAECAFAYRDSYFKSAARDRYLVVEVTFALRPGARPALRYAELQRAFAEHPTAPTLAEVRECVLALRRRKSMVLDPNDANGRSCGSFFVNPVLDSRQFAAFRERTRDDAAVPTFPESDGRTKLPAAWLIERAGFARGTRDGAVGLSSRHALAIVAHDGARAEDVKRFAARIQRGVFERFGIELEREAVYW